MPKEIDVINDIQYLCDKLCLCSLTTEIDNIEEDTGVACLVSLIFHREINIFIFSLFYEIIISYNY